MADPAIKGTPTMTAVERVAAFDGAVARNASDGANERD